MKANDCIEILLEDKTIELNEVYIYDFIIECWKRNISITRGDRYDIPGREAGFYSGYYQPAEPDTFNQVFHLN